MELRVLGANGTYPTAGRPTAGYLLMHDQTRIWLDAGSGTLLALQELMDPADLDALVISHRHVDHSVDVFSLYHYLRFGSDRDSPLPLFVPEGLTDQITSFVGSGPEFAAAFAAVTPGAGTEATVGSVAMRFGRATHTVPTLQLRVQAGGRSLAYSADTGLGSDLSALAESCHALLVEASFQGREKPAPHHLTAIEAGEIANQAGVERLILTHIMPSLDPQQSIAEAEAVFGGEVIVATPGLEVSI